MSTYESFAEVYDIFMEDTPYDRWTEYLKKIFQKHGLINNTNIIAELGCGTGNMTQRLAQNGFDMIGIDISENMLAKAREKTTPELNILYLNQDMRDFELYGTVDAVVSLCDSINYITQEDELLRVFKLVNNYLEPKGLFVFDINTIYKFREILGDNSFCETTENSAYTWENYYDENENINEFYTNFFIKDNATGLYTRHEEFHYEKGYEINKIKELLEKAGLEFQAVYEELTFRKPTEKSQRAFFVAREKEK